jgi:hypothetical protein
VTWRPVLRFHIQVSPRQLVAARYLPSGLNAALEQARGQHVTVLGSSGDNGAIPPTAARACRSACPPPTPRGVGGTILDASPGGAYVGEMAWNGNKAPAVSPSRTRRPGAAASPLGCSVTGREILWYLRRGWPVGPTLVPERRCNQTHVGASGAVAEALASSGAAGLSACRSPSNGVHNECSLEFGGQSRPRGRW